MKQWQTLVAAAMAAALLATGAQAKKTGRRPTPAAQSTNTWTADNGNGTFTNPLFYDEFSDPDMIRVGNDFYLTGTTMHSMPGLPILHTRDLVNWTFLGYASDQLDLGPAYRLEGGQSRYGQGIWAPSFRYHNGTFYIFSNVNGKNTQVFRATNPAGPWTHTEMKRSLHDLSVLFDDDGKAYAIWGYRGIHMIQLNDDLTDAVPGTEKVIIPEDAGMGEGVHFYKLNGKYFITSAWFDGRMRMPAARADNIWGPYEVNQAISTDEDFGLREGHRLGNEKTPPFTITPPNTRPDGRVSLHQGGLVYAGNDSGSGEWWGFTMMDFNSVGRLTSLSPITWKDGWPYFGLPGNLKRTPRTWVKPATGAASPAGAPYQRSDSFSSATMAPIWQWSHVPDNSKWSLTERPGFLRLHALPAADLWSARNSLTQRAIGPQSRPTTVIDTSGMAAGDVAGLSVFGKPYAWIGVERGEQGASIAQFDQQTGITVRVPLAGSKVWLRADCDYLTEKAHFSYSQDGKTFHPLGEEFTMVFQLTTFQGMRYALFNYNTNGTSGGYADFDAFDVHEPHPRGLMRPIPYTKTIRLDVPGPARAPFTIGGAGTFTVADMGLGRAALKSGTRYVSVQSADSVLLKAGKPGEAESFQWIETPTGELALMSLRTHRFLRRDPQSGRVFADSPGPRADGLDGVSLIWKGVTK